MSRETIITNIKGLWLPVHSNVQVIKGSELSKTNLLENAWLLIQDGIIQGFGQMDSF
jgi:imidazolonepropionase